MKGNILLDTYEDLVKQISYLNKGDIEDIIKFLKLQMNGKPESGKMTLYKWILSLEKTLSFINNT